MVKGDAGGRRSILFNDLNDVTVKAIKERAIKLFFPNGQSIKGKRTEFNFTLQDQNEEFLIDFKDKNDKKCSYTEYLETIGRFASHVRFTLISNKVESQDSDIESENSSFKSFSSEENLLSSSERQ